MTMQFAGAVEYSGAHPLARRRQPLAHRRLAHSVPRRVEIPEPLVCFRVPARPDKDGNMVL